MSAYICNPEQFGILAAYATLNRCVVSEWIHYPADALQTAQRVAKGLARENIRSVAHRYPDDADGGRPGPCLLDAEVEEAAALYAAHFMSNPHYVKALRPISVIKISQGVDYQSCETDVWRETLAWRQLDWINNEAIRQLPGYEDADWSYNVIVPEIEALYERTEA